MSVLKFDEIKSLLNEGLTELVLTDLPDKSVYLKPLSSKKQIEIQGLARDLKTAADELVFKRTVLQATIVDTDGNLMFDAKTIDNFLDLNCKIVNQVYNEVIKLNFPTAVQLEETAKNLQPNLC